MALYNLPKHDLEDLQKPWIDMEFRQSQGNHSHELRQLTRLKSAFPSYLASQAKLGTQFGS